MNILHLGSGNRWTGAVAPAFAEVEALRDAGISAHFAYVGGYKLEWKIGQRPYAHPIIGRRQDPASFIRTVAELRRFITKHSIDVVHAHLSYDHWITRFDQSGTARRRRWSRADHRDRGPRRRSTRRHAARRGQDL